MNQTGYQPTNKNDKSIPPSIGSSINKSIEQNKLCECCIKSDVCNIKDDVIKNIKLIQDVVSDGNQLDLIISCKKFAQQNTYTGIRK